MTNHFLNPTTLYDEAARRRKELLNLIRSLDKNSASYPEGDIRIVHRKSVVQFYLRKTVKDNNGKYLAKSEEKRIRALLQKKYEKSLHKAVSNEISCLEKCLKLKGSQETMENLYAELPSKVKEYIMPYAVAEDDYVKMWLDQPYVGKFISADAPVFVTDKGDHVRSKSELNIANALYKLGIPYKYECPLTLRKGLTIHPDFTVLDVKRRREIYWEHRGMMDDKDYSNHSVSKVKEYEHAGIFLGERLIITEETSSVPLGSPDIDIIIKHSFLL